MTSNFCPAPWMSLFVQGDTTSVCCVDTNKLPLTTKQFLASSELKEMKESFLSGKTPRNCEVCSRWESQGLQSIRQHYKDNYPEYTIDNISVDTVLPVKHMELRTSNLCNYSCRMCNIKNSIEIEREVDKNSHLVRWYPHTKVNDTSDNNWNEILELTNNLNRLILTGGEPLLMKEYYELMEHAIENGKNDDINLVVFTNCSVYNPKFIDKLLKFKSVTVNLSIDAVGSVAEYQRKGTDWKVVEENVKRFADLPVKLGIQTTITAYSVLDFHALAKYYKDVLQYRHDTNFVAHTSVHPKPLHYSKLSGKLRRRAIRQVELSIQELDNPRFGQIVQELKGVLTTLKNSDTIDSSDFVSMTKDLDISRNESFEEVFGYILD